MYLQWIGEVGWLPSFCYCTAPKRAYSITTPACHSRCFHRTAVTTVHYITLISMGIPSQPPLLDHLPV